MGIVITRGMAGLGLIAALSVASGAGCSNLIVKKVPLEDRIAGCDDQQGFRYYLNRPYLIVKKPILISERTSLVKVDPKTFEVTFVSGPRMGQTVPLDQLGVQTLEGTARPVTPAELSRIEAALRASLGDEAVTRTDLQVSSSSESQSIGAAVTTDGARGSIDESEGAVATLATEAETKVLTLPDYQSGKTIPASSAPALGDMEIVYLPDLDEQYVVKSKNHLAKSAFGLAFRNGTELVEVQGEHDSTTLAISLLDQVQRAIGAAQGVAEESIKRDARTLKAQQGDSGTGTKATVDGLTAGHKLHVYKQIERIVIKAGCYRLNKPWEVEPASGAPMPIGSGLLAQLGLPTESKVDYELMTILEPQPGRGETSTR